MGLIQVNTTTITSATKTSSLALTGINSNDVYLFAFSNMNVEADITVAFRFTESGTANNSANYDYARRQFNTGGSLGSVSGQNQTFINWQVATSASCDGSGLVYLYNFNDSSEYSFCTYEFAMKNVGYSDSSGSVGGAVLTVDSACDGIALITGTGYEINSGTYTLYKVV